MNKQLILLKLINSNDNMVGGGSETGERSNLVDKWKKKKRQIWQWQNKKLSVVKHRLSFCPKKCGLKY